MTAPPPDPRRTPWRPDLAADHLRGTVAAARFAAGDPHRVSAGTVTLRGAPDETARQTSELLHGEGFTVYDRQAGWAWGQGTRDGYVGWTREEALRPGAPAAATHVVTALRSFLFPLPDLKAPVTDALPLGAAVTVVEESGAYGRLADGGWVFLRHLAAAGTVEADPVAVAERLLGVPYLWGGRTPLGIDCSGLVQLGLHRAGLDCPRDSDMQRAEVGRWLSPDGAGVAYRRGDILFFPGHVGFMLDGARLLHATAHTMTVTVEPLADVAARAGGITGVRRLG